MSEEGQYKDVIVTFDRTVCASESNPAMDNGNKTQLAQGYNSFASTFLNPQSQKSKADESMLGRAEYEIVLLNAQEIEVKHITIGAREDSPTTKKEEASQDELDGQDKVTNKDSLVVLKSSVHSSAKSRNALARQQETHYDDQDEPVRSLYEPHNHHQVQNQSSGGIKVSRPEGGNAYDKKYVNNSPSLKNLQKNEQIVSKVFDGSIHEHGSTKQASDATTAAGIHQHIGGSQYLGLKQRLGRDDTTQGSLLNLRHNVLIPNEHKFDLGESQQLTPSTFSIRKHSMPARMLSHMRNKHGPPNSKQQDHDRQRFNNQQQTPKISLVAGSAGELSFTDPEQVQFQSLVILGSSNRQQQRIDELSQSQPDSSQVQLLSRESHEQVRVQDFPDPVTGDQKTFVSSSNVSSIQRGQEMLFQSTKNIQKAKQLQQTLGESQEIGQKFYKKTQQIMKNGNKVASTEVIVIETPRIIPENLLDAANGKDHSHKANKMSYNAIKQNNMSFGNEQSLIKDAIANGSQLTKKNRAYFITKSDVTPQPSEPKEDEDTMKRLNTKNVDMGKDHILESSAESGILKFLKTGDFSESSKKSLEVIKEIFGGSHAECRALMKEMSMNLLKSQISVTEEQVVKLSKQQKNTPIIFNAKYQVDQKVELESQINPLLVKPTPLNLPKQVREQMEQQRRISRQEKPHARSVTSEEKNFGSASLAKAQSNDDILLDLKKMNNLDSRLQQLQMSASNERSDGRHRKKQSPETVSYEYITQKMALETPIITGQHKLQTPNTQSNKNISRLDKLCKTLKEKGPIDLRDLRALESSLAKMQELDQRKTKAQLKLYQNQFDQKLTRQRIVNSMLECRMVQKSLRAASTSDFDRQGSLSPDRIEFNATSKKSLPVASTSYMPNYQIRDNIVELLHQDVNQNGASVKQITADRKVRSLAKHRGLNNAKKEEIAINAAQSLIEVQSAKQQPTDEKDHLARLDSQHRRRVINHMNDKIKVKNMQKIYKLKGIEKKKQKQTKGRNMAATVHYPISTKHSSITPLVPVKVGRRNHWLPPTEHASSRESIVEEMSLFGSTQAGVSVKPHITPISQLQTYLPKIQIRSSGNSQEDHRDEDDNLQESLEFAFENHLENRVEVGQADIMTAVLSEEQNRNTVSSKMSSSQEGLEHGMQPQPQLSLADLVQKQAQQVYYQQQTNERFFSIHATGAHSSAKQQYQESTNRTCGIHPDSKYTTSARFHDDHNPTAGTETTFKTGPFEVQGRSTQISNKDTLKRSILVESNQPELKQDESRNLPLVSTAAHASSNLIKAAKQSKKFGIESRSSSVAARTRLQQKLGQSDLQKNIKRSLLPRLIAQKAGIASEQHPYASSQIIPNFNVVSREVNSRLSHQAFQTAIGHQKTRQKQDNVIRTSEVKARQDLRSLSPQQNNFGTVEMRSGVHWLNQETTEEDDGSFYVEDQLLQAETEMNLGQYSLHNDSDLKTGQSEMDLIHPAMQLPRLPQQVQQKSIGDGLKVQEGSEDGGVSMGSLEQYFQHAAKLMITGLKHEQSIPPSNIKNNRAVSKFVNRVQRLIPTQKDISTSRTTQVQNMQQKLGQSSQVTPERKSFKSSVSTVKLNRFVGVSNHKRDPSQVSSSELSQPMELQGQRYNNQRGEFQQQTMPKSTIVQPQNLMKSFKPKKAPNADLYRHTMVLPQNKWQQKFQTPN